MANFPYVTPKTLKELKVEVNGKEVSYDEVMNYLGSVYEAFVNAGVPKEDARFVLPNACATRVLFTMNGEELVHFLRLRTCSRAQWEIREMAIKVLLELRKGFPELFKNVGPNCYYLGYCTEGKKSCGKPDEVRDFFRNLEERYG